MLNILARANLPAEAPAPHGSIMDTVILLLQDTNLNDPGAIRRAVMAPVVQEDELEQKIDIYSQGVDNDHIDLINALLQDINLNDPGAIRRAVMGAVVQEDELEQKIDIYSQEVNSDLYLDIYADPITFSATGANQTNAGNNDNASEENMQIETKPSNRATFL
jgi:hypothetical protein